MMVGTSASAPAAPSLGRIASPHRALTWFGYALLLAVAPLLFTSGLSQTLLSQMGIAIIACLSFNILLGQGGMLSFGHAVYSGIGAFAAIHTLNRINGGWALPVSLVPLVGGVAGAVLAGVLGWVTTKKSATPFAMITFGMGELIWASALMFPEVFGGEAGVSGNRVVGSPVWGISWGPQLQVTYLIAAYTLVCTWLMYSFTRTPLGRLLNAVRDNPERVAFVGYNPQMVRYLSFVIAAFFAGVAGGLAALNFELVTAEVFSAYRSGAYLIFTYLGGTAFFIGPILGGMLMVLAFVLLSEFSRAWLLYLGSIFLLMVMYAPGGVASIAMVNWRVAQRGHLGRLLPHYLALLAGVLPAVLGAAALVEMLYHRQMEAVLGPDLLFMGLPLSTQSKLSWLAIAAVCMVGLGVFALARRRFTKFWEAIEAEVVPEPRRREFA
jgi:branched-chain amino acid transport system permease protein